MTKKTSNRFSPEVWQRAVRMVLEHGGDHASQWAAIGSIAGKIGCAAETLRTWVRQAERDRGQRPGPATDERERIKALEREVRELRQANDAFARSFVGRRVSRTANAGFVLDALEQALHDRRPLQGGLVHGHGVSLNSVER